MTDVMLVSRIYSPEPSAASMRLESLTRELHAQGHTVRVVTSRFADALSGEEHGISVSRWPVLRDPAGYVRGYLQYMSFDIPMVFRVLFGRAPDVYVCEPPPTTGFLLSIAAWLKRRPMVYYAADVWSDASAATTAPAWVVRVVRWVESRALARARSVLAVSDAVAHRVRALAPRANVSVVGHGVDTTVFSPEVDVAKPGADLVYVGTASEVHGAEIVLDALPTVLAEHPDLTVAFIGQGSSWPRLQTWVQEQGLHGQVSFHTRVSPQVAATWLRSARVSLATVRPGQGYDFAVPTKIYASLAVGTPVAYAGPEPVRSMIADNQLGHGGEYDAAAFAAGIVRALSGHSHHGRESLVAWATENVSAVATARRSVTDILDAARRQ